MKSAYANAKTLNYVVEFLTIFRLAVSLRFIKLRTSQRLQMQIANYTIVNFDLEPSISKYSVGFAVSKLGKTKNSITPSGLSIGGWADIKKTDKICTPFFSPTSERNSPAPNYFTRQDERDSKLSDRK